MARIVQKFGGSSVANAERIFRVAKIITDAYAKGNEMCVVLSAQGDTTDDLIAKAEEINPNASKREMDMLLACGEQMSIALMAMAIEKLGYPVVSLCGWQVGMNTSSTHSFARIKKVTCERVKEELDKKRIVLVAGFQGVDKYGDVTTLGRGGSDTTAVAMAVALQADLCQIFTDVDGVYTCDPRIVPEAKKLPEITYNEMLELASLGVQAAIRIGSCGALQKGIGLGELVLVTGAVRDDGASKAYVPAIYPAVADFTLYGCCVEAAKTLGAVTHEGICHSHESFYHEENEAESAYWSKKGVLGADMETAALFTIGRLRGMKTASILNNVVLYGEDTADSIGDYVGGESATAKGERLEILTALEAFYLLETRGGK